MIYEFVNYKVIKMKICILTTVDSPFDSRVFYKEAKSLAKVHGVIVIAPSDEPIDEEIEGIRVITVRKPAYKILHVITLWRILKECLKQECDVCHCHAPGGLFLGALLKISKRMKVVYDAREHYPSLIAENSLFPDFIRSLVRFFADIEERMLIRFADVVITVDEILASKYRKHHNNVDIISNYPRLELFKPDDLNSENGGIIYVGGISKDRGFYQMINTANKANVKLICVGNFTDELNENEITNFLERNPSKNVVFTGYLAHSKVVEYINMSKLGLNLLQPIPRYKKAVPIKLFEYMACGKPVVVSNFPEIKKIVEEEHCGILVDPTNVNEITDAILYLLEHPEEAKKMGENGRRAVEERYNWARMEEKLLTLYEGLK
ncbi:MAG TPA: glycosyltransferase WbuB [Methanophagales archaeon]|nr:glycosyltransferase WbuB [Methanophagales archaeon]